MTSPVALLQLPGSPLAEALRPRIESRDVPCRVLDLDAPFSGRPVTIRPGRVSWDGFDLLSAAALLVERPIFPWPQPMQVEALSRDPEVRSRTIATERETRSLIVSALRAVAELRPVLNPPQACHLVASPATALDRAARAKMPVATWRLEPSDRSRPGELRLDPVGGDRWHRSGPPAPGEPTLILEARDDAVTTLLVVGPRVAGAVHHEKAEDWASRGIAEGRPADSFDAAAVETALKTTWALNLELAAITVAGTPDPEVLYIDAAPDLTAWGRVTEGRTLDALADRLVSVHAIGVEA